mmetsp:Transcript_108007/g.161585  ORF Transcript_108007/g.161585 Transcript_108007/m.161585 type:complete len:426 (+) Transcript_108007:204-1481(+)
MTCYPKEEIIGKNCRFLQGPDTDPEIVKNIRKAVDEGLELEVELLNYRKDGVPFYNVFLMLPIHAPKKKEGEVHYFIAIQKDITVLRQPGSNPRKWTPAEVGMWLYHSGLRTFMGSFSEKKINGEKLFELSQDELLTISPNSSLPDRRVLLTKITELGLNPAKAFPIDTSKIENFNYKLRAKDENLQMGQKVNTSKTRSWWRSRSVSKKDPLSSQESSQKTITEDSDLDFSEESSHMSDVRDICSGNLITVKAFYKKKISVMQVPATISYSMLVDKLVETFCVPVKIRYKDLDGDWVIVEDDDCVEAAILCSLGGTLSLKVKKRFKPLSQEKQMYLNPLPIGMVVLDSEGCIVFMNRFAQVLVDMDPHEYMRRKFTACVATLNFENVGENQEIQTVEGSKTLNAFLSPDKVEHNQIVLLSPMSKK